MSVIYKIGDRVRVNSMVHLAHFVDYMGKCGTVTYVGDTYVAVSGIIPTEHLYIWKRMIEPYNGVLDEDFETVTTKII